LKTYRSKISYNIYVGIVLYGLQANSPIQELNPAGGITPSLSIANKISMLNAILKWGKKLKIHLFTPPSPPPENISSYARALRPHNNDIWFTGG